GLLLPAVQKVREAAARTQMTNFMAPEGDICRAFDAYFKAYGVYPASLDDPKLLPFTPKNQTFQSIAFGLDFDCFLYRITSSGTPGVQAGWNFSLCTLRGSNLELCIDKSCAVATTVSPDVKDTCPKPTPVPTPTAGIRGHAVAMRAVKAPPAPPPSTPFAAALAQAAETITPILEAHP